MQYMKNSTKTKKFWSTYRKDAGAHFNVSPRTIDLWLNKGEPQLIFWLTNEMKNRIENKREASIRKVQLMEMSGALK